jgi:hypothetical protein
MCYEISLNLREAKLDNNEEHTAAPSPPHSARQEKDDAIDVVLGTNCSSNANGNLAVF